MRRVGRLRIRVTRPHAVPVYSAVTDRYIATRVVADAPKIVKCHDRGMRPRCEAQTDYKQEERQRELLHDESFSKSGGRTLLTCLGGGHAQHAMCDPRRFLPLLYWFVDNAVEEDRLS